MPETEQRNINRAALPDLHTSSGDNVLFCPLPSVRVRSRGFPQMGGCCLLKYNGGNSGIKISVIYWRYSLIRVSVIRGSTGVWLPWSPIVTISTVALVWLPSHTFLRPRYSVTILFTQTFLVDNTFCDLNFFSVSTAMHAIFGANYIESLYCSLRVCY
jgi:hypothetical protein